MSSSEALNEWFNGAAVGLKVQWVGGALQLDIEASEGSFVGYLVAVAAKAIASGEWTRLKSCPDCQWAFYANATPNVRPSAATVPAQEAYAP